MTETRTVVMERELAFPPEKVWRALTQPHLMAEWLMQNDFHPVVDHTFTLRADWGEVTCQVLAIDPPKTLTYTWNGGGLQSVVTWTLTPIEAGTRLHMEQHGFGADQTRAYYGAKAGWPRFFDRLVQTLAQQH